MHQDGPTILQAALPFAPWADPRTRRLPGILPLDMADWLVVDDAFAAQMALRDHLIATRPAEVVAALPGAGPAVAELYDFVLDRLPAGYVRQARAITRPDGVTVPLDPAQPLHTLGRLVQEDLCLMQEDGQGEHLLSAAVLCFPSGWRLAEKLGRPMMRIHLPVAKYTEDVGKRVQRLLDAVRPENPLWRANAHHSRAGLFHPRGEAEAKENLAEGPMPLIRSERQCLVRLPVSRAVVFSIHTYVVHRDSLTADQAAALEAFELHRA